MHPALDEFCRINGVHTLQPMTFRRMQRVFRDELQPLLDERDSLITEVAALRREVASLREAAATSTKKIRTPVPV